MVLFPNAVEDLVHQDEIEDPLAFPEVVLRGFNDRAQEALEEDEGLA